MNPITEQKSTVSETVRKRGKVLFSSLVVLLFGLFAFQLWFHATRTSATTDEAPHVLAGYRVWQCGDFGINPEHPPLLKLLATIPLVSQDLIQPSWECGSKVTSKFESFQAGTLFLAKNNADEILISARLMAALLSLLLAALVFLATREMFGRWEAIVALAILAFEPNLIAHGSLVTTDMALTVTMFAAVYALYRYGNSPTWFRFLLVGLATGAVLASKHSGILTLPILFALLLIDVLLSRRAETKTFITKQILRRAAVFAGIVFIGFIILWASYGFRYYALPNRAETTLSIEDFLNGTSPEAADSISVRAIKAVNQTRILPESYTFGLADVITKDDEMFLLGKVYPTGRWFYFPAAFSIKTSVALLVLLAFGLMTFQLYRNRRREMLFLLVPSLVFFAVSMTSGINIGVRHILPIYPFFIVIAAAGACVWSRKYLFVRYLLIALLIFHAAAAFRTAPNYLAFANDFWGGTNNTHNLLANSNVEWGQNFKLVNEYLARENIKDCRIAPFGNGELILKYQPCRLMPGDWGWNFTEQPVEIVPPVVEGTILLSTSVSPLFNHPEFQPFADSKPIALIGGSIFVYQGRFEIPLISALSYVGRAQQLNQLNRLDEAIENGQKAIELAPDDPRPHLVLGASYFRAKRTDEARREYETTIRLAESNPEQFSVEKMRAQYGLRRLQQ